MGVGSAVTVDVDVSVAGKVGTDVLLLAVGVREGVLVGTPITAVAFSGFGEEVIEGRIVGETDAFVAVATTGATRPAFCIAHLPNPVRETITPMRRTQTSPVKPIPPAEVG
jgi:hypothetical protein